MSQGVSTRKAKVEIYTRPFCSFCTRAKLLLDDKQVAYIEYEMTDFTTHRAMVERSGGRNTFPQIFINDQPVGGCSELMVLEMDGELDSLLSDQCE